MKTFLLAALSCFFVAVKGQSLPVLSTIKMERVADYRLAEPFVLQTANYLLGKPYDEKNKDAQEAYQFLAKWMEGTPDFSFTLESTLGKIGKTNIPIVSSYIAALCKISIENKALASNKELIKLNAMKLLLTYVENPANNVRINKPLKKFSEANKKGELDKALL